VLAFWLPLDLGTPDPTADDKIQGDKPTMTFDEFDQMMDGGWRAIAKQGDFAGAAQAIIEYLETEQALEDWQERVLHFHAVQMYAFAGAVEEALGHLPFSLVPEEPADTPIRWNTYVEATEAFLRGDREGLVAAREIIAQGPMTDVRIPNLGVVDRLIANFGKPYSQAY